MRKKMEDLKTTKKSKTRENVKKLIAEIARMDVDKVDEGDSIRDDLGIDSLMAMEMLAAIEKRLGISIDEAKAFNVVTAKDLIDLVMFYSKKRKRP
jgi:acyl carrier protein